MKSRLLSESTILFHRNSFEFFHFFTLQNSAHHFFLKFKL
ncbi:hypothetical protein HOLDEFILI_02158 [Holdemania filiformis DSM 12042]|uniref:Uncharacterized protein n=1 Tax=Holdemania filiformis DSM 12042 TaxID=545696 RepID=B9Y8L1_9FIRM|nr:hypothetical protein HOLDEFILI_02158 [Holdemania filiformis DSM 12042]